MIQVADTPAPARQARRWAAAVDGLVAGLLTVGLATLLAAGLERLGLTGGQPAPVAAVGGAFIDRTPPWLKDLAIAAFGTNDKRALLVGTVVVLAAVCGGLGLLAKRRPLPAFVAYAALGAVGMSAVLSRPGALPLDAAPTLLGTVTGLWFLRRSSDGHGSGTLGPVAGRAHGDAAHGKAAHGDAAHGEAAHGEAAHGDAPPGATADGSRADGGRGPSRRWLLGGAVGGTAAYVGTVLGGTSRAATASRAAAVAPAVAVPVRVPAGADLKVPGASAFVVPNAQFYRIDTALVVPRLDAAQWRLRVTGMVQREVEIDWATLQSKPMREALVTLACVSNEVGGNLVGNAVWTGWPVRELLAMAGPRPGADMVLQTSADGWTCGTPLEVLTDDRNALLAVRMNGEPLPFEHGFPVRLVVPGLYGYVSATKWVTQLKVTRFDQDQGYWTPRGWSARGPVKTASRIDVPRAGATVAAGRVAVAGVAWAQHRGISAVEVSVDDGPWQPARLAADASVDAWRQWVYEWDAVRGSSTLRVRATDGTGQLQVAAEAPPAPDGATGLHTVPVTVA